MLLVAMYIVIIKMNGCAIKISCEHYSVIDGRSSWNCMEARLQEILNQLAFDSPSKLSCSSLRPNCLR